MGNYGELWGIMGNYGELWGSMGNYGELLGIMGNYGELWGSMGNYGVLWGIMGKFWGYMGKYGELWGIMGFYGVVWGIMGLYGVVWGCMGNFHDACATQVRKTFIHMASCHPSSITTAPSTSEANFGIVDTLDVQLLHYPSQMTLRQVLPGGFVKVPQTNVQDIVESMKI